MEKDTVAILAEYEKKRSVICKTFGHQCFKNKCPLRSSLCFDVPSLAKSYVQVRKKIIRAIDRYEKELT